MALDSKQSAALSQNLEFRGRIQFFVVKYAGFLTLEAANTPRHLSAMIWVRRVQQQPLEVATTLHPFVVDDPAVQTDGADINDAGLSAAVETAINKWMI